MSVEGNQENQNDQADETIIQIEGDDNGHPRLFDVTEDPENKGK